MKKFSFLYKLVYVLVVLLICFTSTAYAYLDPGTLTYILTLIAGAVVGASTVLKQYWYRIKSIITRKSDKSNISNDNYKTQQSFEKPENNDTEN